MSDKDLWTALDQNYFYPAILSLTSARRRLNSKLVVNIAYDATTLSSKRIEVFRFLMDSFDIEINFHSIPMPNTLPTLGHITSITFGRLELLRTLKDTFIWLDVDTFFPNGIRDLLEFARNLPEGFGFCALPSPISGSSFNGVPNLAVLTSGARYFNAGIFIADPVIWRNSGFGDAWIELLNQYQEMGFIYLDQCIMNYLISGNYVDLPRKFNCIPTHGEILTETPTIVHFAGPNKPWLIQPSNLRSLLGHTLKAFYFRQYLIAEYNLFCNTLFKGDYKILRLLLKYKFDANLSFAFIYFRRKIKRFIACFFNFNFLTLLKHILHKSLKK